MQDVAGTGLRGCFVTGTDTEVGKTRVSSGLLRWLARQGVRAGGYKPVAAGMEQDAQGRWFNVDVRVLQQASSVPLEESQICTAQLRLACAPHIAAEREGRSIDRAGLIVGAHRVAAMTERVVVEGAGGLCVPQAAAGPAVADCRTLRASTGGHPHGGRCPAGRAGRRSGWMPAASGLYGRMCRMARTAAGCIISSRHAGT